jgi:RNA polymerase sigma-70 factor, ECF subfamily
MDLDLSWVDMTIEDRIAGLLRSAREAWPGVELPVEVFVGYLGERRRESETLEAALDRLHVVDLYLACACARGDGRAIACFEARYLEAIPALRELRLEPAAAQDLLQSLRARLFVAPATERPLIAQYAGSGPLAAWVRITAVRAGLELLRKGKSGREVSVQDEVLARLPIPAGDPELLYLKEHYRAQFRDAVRQAISALPPRELNVLQYHYLEGLTTYQIGALYSVHQSTATRWLAKAQQSVLSATRRRMMTLLSIDRAEFESIMRLIESHLDVSLRGLLPAKESASSGE